MYLLKLEYREGNNDQEIKELLRREEAFNAQMHKCEELAQKISSKSSELKKAREDVAHEKEKV